MKRIKYNTYLENELKKDPNLKKDLRRAREAIDIAQQIYDLRKSHGLTQTQFAKLIGVSQPNVARLESADYKSYSIRTLSKAAQALNSNLEIRISPLIPIKTLISSWIIPIYAQTASSSLPTVSEEVEKNTTTINKEIKTPVDNRFIYGFAI